MTDKEIGDWADRCRRFEGGDPADWMPDDNRRPVPSLPHWVAAFCLWAAIMIGAGHWWLWWW